jgi:hypothetical protein
MISSILLYFVTWIIIILSVEPFATLSRRKKINEAFLRFISFTKSNPDASGDGKIDERCFLRRRDFLQIPLVAISVTAIEDMFPKVLPTTAFAAYGDSSNIELPSYVDFLIEKNKQADPSTFLYQGADREAVLNRLKAAISYLETLPAVVQSHKWSQVQGIITGPLGTLTATMRQVSASNQEAKKISAKVKLDLFNIGVSSTSKDEAACLAASEAALQDLNDFVKIAL